MSFFQRRPGACAALALALAGSFLAGEARSEVGDFFKDFGSKIFGKKDDDSLPPPVDPQAREIRCPSVDIQGGTETLTVRVNAKGTETGGVRHQINVTRTARECRLEGDMLHLKVGVAGRVVLGPAGSPGSVTVPVRIAVTRGMTQVVYSKLGRATVTVPPGADSAPYTYVDDSVAFRLGEGDRPTLYFVHVGLDEKGDKPEKPQRRASRQR